MNGLSAANPHLFNARPVLLTPTAETNNDAVALVQGLWHHLKANVQLMSAGKHDETLALTSHLPHLLASCYLLGIADQDSNILQHTLGGGFKDFTRIGESLPSLWRDIFLSNKEELLSHIDHFQNHLTELRTLISNEQSDLLENALEKAMATRHKLKDQLP